MNKNNILILLIIFGLVVGSSLTYAKVNGPVSIDNNAIFIYELFDEIKGKVDSLNENESRTIVAEENKYGLEISLLEFVQYKANKEFVHKLNNIPFSISDEQLINEIMNRKILVGHAQAFDIIIDEDELENYVNEQRNALINANADIKVIEENLIRISGRTKKEY